MSELRFTADHEWLRLDNDGLVTVGITHYAQDALGDVVYVQLPEAKSYAQGEEVAVRESVKAARNIAMPLAGEIVEVNSELEGSPELVNESPLDKAWFVRRRPAADAVLSDLMEPIAKVSLLSTRADARGPSRPKLDPQSEFIAGDIGRRDAATAALLQLRGYNSVDALTNAVIPESIK